MVLLRFAVATVFLFSCVSEPLGAFTSVYIVSIICTKGSDPLFLLSFLSLDDGDHFFIFPSEQLFDKSMDLISFSTSFKFQDLSLTLYVYYVRCGMAVMTFMGL